MRLYSSKSSYLGGVVFILINVMSETLSYTQEEIDNAWKKMGKRKTFFKSLNDRIGCWPENSVPYTIANVFTPEQKQHIINHIYQIQNRTCVRWVEKNLVKDVRKFVEFIHTTQDPSLCQTGEYGSSSSEYGIIVRITLGDECFPEESVIHEMMHALGFLHEHQRLDRDCYVEVDEEFAGDLDFKIITDLRFEKWPYDKRSLTHYTRIERFGFRDKDEPLNGLFIKYRLGDSYGAWGKRGTATGKLTCLDVHKINYVYCGAPDFCELRPKMCRDIEEDEVSQGCKQLYEDILDGKAIPST